MLNLNCKHCLYGSVENHPPTWFDFCALRWFSFIGECFVVVDALGKQTLQAYFQMADVQHEAINARCEFMFMITWKLIWGRQNKSAAHSDCLSNGCKF